MNSQKNSILIIFISIYLLVNFVEKSSSENNDWHFKFTQTKNINSQILIECENLDQIWIGWSHYGTRNINANSNTQNSDLINLNREFPLEQDCWMNFTEKIAEQCNGADRCELSSQPTYIHKCGKISDYLYVTYKCIKNLDTLDICQSNARLSANSELYIKSSDFPNEYSSNLDCSCMLSSSNSKYLKFESLWFSLQDNDYLNINRKTNLTGWINPTNEVMQTSFKSDINLIRFQTDDALAYKGFWLKISEKMECKNDWKLVGNQCLKVFNEQLDWRSASQKCQQMNGNLLKLDDVIADLKLTQYMKQTYPEIQSYWIGLRKYLDSNNKEKWMWSSSTINNNSSAYSDISWWPWRQNPNNTQSDSIVTTNENKCVIKKRNEDGYFTTSCDSTNKFSFICQQNANTQPKFNNLNINIKCGQTNDILKELTTTTTSTTTSTKQAVITNNPSVTSKKLQSKKLVHHTITPFSSSFNPQILLTANPNMNEEIIDQNSNFNNKLNTTTILAAGIICGIGLVIVSINLFILFLCRRNLGKFLKKTDHDKNGKNDDKHSDDMLQEYFEAFQTLHNSKSHIKQASSNSTSTTSSSDDSLLLGGSTLMNPATAHHHQTLFYPARNNLILLQQNANASNTNQYDKINHHNLLILNNNTNNMSVDNDQVYSHTYECLDSIEVANHNNRNRFLIANRNDVSTSSNNSSGASSTHQFIQQNQANNRFIIHNGAQLIDLKHLNEAMLTLNGAGSWSPDSAYYSSIQNNNNNQNNSSFNLILPQLSTNNVNFVNNKNNNVNSFNLNDDLRSQIV